MSAKKLGGSLPDRQAGATLCGGNWAVVMTGGKGTRFWPESRVKRPKPFLKFVGNQTLLEETVNRLRPFFSPQRIVIVIQDSLVKDARRLLRNIPRENFLGEPVQKNTAPCCVWAAAWISRRDPDAKIIFLPADQYIPQKPLYQKTIKTAFQIVDEKPVLLGMQPDRPHTGYGYLELDAQKKTKNGFAQFRVKRFREKPNLSQAQRFLKQGNFLWNGGTFIWRLDAFKKAVQQYAPKIYRSWKKLAKLGARHAVPLRRVYRSFPSISLDYAVMEKMKNVHCLKVPFGWKDVGSWESLADFWKSDSKGNRSQGKNLFIRSEGNIVKAGNRFIALLGAKDLIIVDTPDALLVSSRAESEKIRDIVQALEKQKAKKYL